MSHPTASSVIPWSRPEAPTPRGCVAILQQEGLQPYAWSNGPGFVYAKHEHGYHKVLYCALGGIRFTLPERGEALELKAGDRLELPPGVWHGALVGPEGVTCVEAARTDAR